jgi:Cdc6-like AAA superfamily ATPase
MTTLKDHWRLDADQANALEIQAATVFQPRTPIATRDLFAGRWNEITTLADAVGQPGLHVVIYGERGVGKTSLANVVRPIIHAFDQKEGEPPIPESERRMVIKTNASSDDTFSTIWVKLFKDVVWKDDRPAIGMAPTRKGRISITEAFDLPDVLSVDDVRRVVSQMPGAVFIVDEFDRAVNNASREFTDLMKMFSDFSVGCTVILVGVAETVGTLINDHASIHRSLVQVFLPRMKEDELREILAKAEKSLPIKFSEGAANLIVHMSQGLPHYTHLLALHSVRTSAATLSGFVERISVFNALKEAVKQAQQTVTEKHSKATHSAHKDALYRHVLFGCALAAAQSHDALGYFNPSAVVEPLGSILGKDVEIAAFNNHLSEFSQKKRGEVLERIGQPRAYRFRFSDPLLVPFVFMDAVRSGLVSNDQLSEMLGDEFIEA